MIFLSVRHLNLQDHTQYVAIFGFRRTLTTKCLPLSRGGRTCNHDADDEEREIVLT